MRGMALWKICIMRVMENLYHERYGVMENLYHERYGVMENLYHESYGKSVS